MIDRFRLDGKTALVTGGSSGIGLGLARGLADAGADLILVARRASELTDAAQQLVAATGRKVVTVSFDLADSAGIEVFYASTIAEHGPIDILVNNAGMSRRGPAHELTLDDWQTVMDLNLTAVFALCQAFAKERIASQRSGKIVNIGSLMCSASRPNTSPYSASKGGVLLLTKALALDWAKYGIRVNAIGPGYIETPLTKSLVNDPKFDAWVKERCPLGRWGTPEDLASVAVFLAAPASDFVTGQIVYADGGWLAHI
ncbi:MAG TPA: glucose 1-dehydrogenase [Pirellulaceae bacterium]|nr:glucose 1-dehydrogenase [Pirellulaceae bacterium]